MNRTKSQVNAPAEMPHDSRQQVCVIGGGVAGLATSLALSAKGFAVTVVEADPSPNKIIDLTDDRAWIDARRGAPQSFHPHFLMARLRSILADQFPALLAELEAAGVWTLPLAETLDDRARVAYKARPGDDLLAPLCARRSTFEQVLRNHIVERKIADIRHGCRFRKLTFTRSETDLIVTGCVVEQDSTQSVIPAQFVVDAAGRGSPCLPLMRELGVVVDEEVYASGLIYLTQRFRLRPGQCYPHMSGIPAAEFESFFIGAHPADNGFFTVTIGFWSDDDLIARAARSVASFKALAEQIPKIASWIDDARAEAVGGPRRFGNIDYIWRSVRSLPVAVHHLFLVGDSQIRTNPKFGRGCTWAFLSSLALAESCTVGGNPNQLALYQQKIRRLFRRDWETMQGLDRNALRRSQVARGTASARVGERWRWAVEDAILIDAMAHDAAVHREIVRAYHGFTTMTAWLFKLRTWKGLFTVLRKRAFAGTERFGREGWPSRAVLAQASKDAEA